MSSAHCHFGPLKWTRLTDYCHHRLVTEMEISDGKRMTNILIRMSDRAPQKLARSLSHHFHLCCHANLSPARKKMRQDEKAMLVQAGVMRRQTGSRFADEGLTALIWKVNQSQPSPWEPRLKPSAVQPPCCLFQTPDDTNGRLQAVEAIRRRPALIFLHLV